MKKLSILFCSLVAIFVMSSCSTEINTVAHSRTVNANLRTAKVMPINIGVKVDYDKRVQYISEVINLKNVGGMEGALETAKFDCLYKNNMDVLIDPIYKITKYDNKNVIVMLQAHPGYYVEAPACAMKNACAKPECNKGCKSRRNMCNKQHCAKRAHKCHRMSCATPCMPFAAPAMPCPQPGMAPQQGNCHQGMCGKQQGDCHQPCQGNDKGQCQEKCKKEGGECSHK